MKFSWDNAGTSADATESNKKTVLSIGSTGSERIITNVAAGNVTSRSTDAVNAGQLYSVIDVFGKLGVDVLGAEVEKDSDKYGFKTPTFAKLVDVNGESIQVPVPKTFKDAIDKNIEKINAGLKFSADINEANTNDKKHYLGTTIKIVKMESNNQSQTQDKFVGDNLQTKYTYENETAKIEIGLKEKPTFKQILIEENNRW